MQYIGGTGEAQFLGNDCKCFDSGNRKMLFHSDVSYFQPRLKYYRYRRRPWQVIMQLD
ncbi:MAG: hypothetical protein OFPI_27580 [Osedax symbiont Rs2]|nr:MAG: hypothetical protein OFPI_27580 [Osedax symbiont Rs2]